VKAVVTAGGRIDGAFAQAAGCRVKALASVGGETMLARILQALRAAGATRIAVIGGEEVRAACAGNVELFVAESDSGSENLLRALRAWPEDGEALLYATSDLPYVTPDGIRDFLRRLPAGTLGVALSEFAAFEARFPSAPPSGITLAGERVVNGGLFSIPSGAAVRLASVASRFFDARKHPWRMAGIVSPFVLVRFLSGRLSIGHLERLARDTLGIPAMGVRGCAPELAFDVDNEAEYRYACTHG
jgi:GTP:adenosylcobinamide-phosphate guanylyltransferase